MKIISLFINSPEFKKSEWDETDQKITSRFTFYDPLGWTYTNRTVQKDPEIPKNKFKPEYLVDDEELNFRKILLYKDAYLFYGTLTLYPFLRFDIDILNSGKDFFPSSRLNPRCLHIHSEKVWSAAMNSASYTFQNQPTPFISWMGIRIRATRILVG